MSKFFFHSKLTKFSAVNVQMPPSVFSADLCYRRLEVLSLQNSKNDIIHHLKLFGSLQELYLVYNQIGKEDTETLAANLHHCTKLKKLDLSKNMIDEDSILKLSSGLRHCTHLQQLLLDYNRVGRKGAVALSRIAAVYGYLVYRQLAFV